MERRKGDRREADDRRRADRRKTAPRWRILARFTLVYLLIFGALLAWFYRFSTNIATNQLRKDLLSTAVGAVAGLDASDLVGLSESGRANAAGFSDDARYKQEVAWFTTIHRLNPQVWPYTFVRDKDQAVYLVDLDLGAEKPTAHFRERDALNAWARQVFETGAPVVRPEVYTDKFGRWMSAYVPLKDASGQVVAALGMDYDASYVAEVQRAVAGQMGSVFVGVYLLVTIVAWYVYRVRHLRELFGRYVSLSLLRDFAMIELGYASRRKVTVLFTDINNFSTQCEQFSAEEVIEMLNRYFEEMNEIIVKSGGWIKQFVGDEIMVIYGAPDDHPRPEQAAVEAACKMVRKLEEMKASAQQPGFFEIKVGIHTGEVIVGNVGSIHRTEYAAVGDDVNLGSRIMGMCKSLDATVLLSGTTYAGVASMPGVQFTDKGAHLVKGRVQKVQIYEVTTTESFR